MAHYNTICYYENCFKLFTKYYPKNSEIQTINNKTIQNFIIWYQGNSGNSPITVNTNLRGIRAFLYYCMKFDFLSKFKIELIKAEKKIKDTYSDSELQILLFKPNIKKSVFAEYRDWVIINYLLATGNRLSTLINIKIKDIDLINNYIILTTTKNKRQQIIPMSKTLSDIIIGYLGYRKGQGQDYLFCNAFGNILCRRSLQDSISDYNKKRGVMKTSIHLFRHTFAKKWILAGGDIFRLQKILGHSSLEIVKEYVNMFNEDLKQDFDRFNPLEQMTVSNKSIKMR